MCSYKGACVWTLIVIKPKCGPFSPLLLTFLHLCYILAKMSRIDWSKHNYHNDTKVQTQKDRENEAYLRDVERSKLRFGKHKGKTLQEVPMLYLRWIKNTWLPNSKFAKATIDNATHEISRRLHSTQENKNKGCKS